MSLIHSLPEPEYRALPALSISRLKEIKRSPLHYKHSLTHSRKSAAMTLGTAAHMAVLEPARFATSYAVWTARTSAGAMAPRKGSAWDAFLAENEGKESLTLDEHTDAISMQDAIRSCPAAMRYLASGEAEVSMRADMHGRDCRGRIDWLTTVDTLPHIVDVKTARDCRPFVFGKQSATLGYHMQLAWYHDLYAACNGGQEPLMKVIVVESAPPYAVAVYHITEDILAQGREDYLALLAKLTECEATDTWPGPVDGEEDLTLPTWAYTQAPDDLTDLGLE
jgi:PDDEXK-like domain of unknown function (DUF3799)